MEAWEAFIEAYPITPDTKDFNKALQTATEVFKEDLAEFETDRLLDTLFYSPVDLLKTVSIKYNVDTWNNSIIDAFKLIAEVLPTHPDALRPHCDNIEKICLLPFSSDIQRQSLTCLHLVTKIWALSQPLRHVVGLDNAANCKTELARLVGTICEYHPEVVQDNVTEIWRIYLRHFEDRKKSNKLVNAILLGVCGLLKNFGQDLPISELATFYDAMVVWLDTKQCEEACLTMLEKYAYLFPERITRDINTRFKVWNLIDSRTNASSAILSMYGAIGHDALKNIIQQEIVPRANASGDTRTAALRTLSHVRARGFDPGDLTVFANVHELEFDIRCGVVHYNVADLISWYIDSRLTDCEKLLQTVLLFIQNIPSTKQKDIYKAMAGASPEVRAEAVSFLATESCHPTDDEPNSIDKYMDIWQGVLKFGACEILEDFVNHVTFALEVFLEEGHETLPEKLSSLLILTARLLNATTVEAAEQCAKLLPWLTRCRQLLPGTASLLFATASALRHFDEDTPLTGVWSDESIRVDRCRDEDVLYASCLTLLCVPITKINCGDILNALQILFSRNKDEHKTLIRGVKKLEDLINQHESSLPSIQLNEVIKSVEKWRSRKDSSGKDGRLLHREVVMFLGKFRRKTDVDNNETEINTVISKLKDTFYLKIPNVDDGVTYKVNLREVLHLAILHEDPEPLGQLLKILCVNLSSQTQRGSDKMSALLLVCRALCRAHARGLDVDVIGVQGALMYCKETTQLRQLLTFISEERSPGVRKMLSDALEALLVSGSDELVRTVATCACDMMSSPDSTSRRAGLDITETLSTSLKDNHALIKELVPFILEIIPRTWELEAISTFENTSELLLDKIALFDVETIENLIKNILKSLMEGFVDFNDNIFKSIMKKSLIFIKELSEKANLHNEIVMQMFIDICNREELDFDASLYVFADLKRNLDLQSSFCSIILHNNHLLDGVFNMDFENVELFKLEAILVFLKEFSETLLELNYNKTIQVLSALIKYVNPKHVINLEKKLSATILAYTDILKSVPRNMQNSFEEWTNKQPINEITTCLEKDKIKNEHADIVNSLRILLEIFNNRPTILNLLQHWPKYILKLFICGTRTSYLTACLTAAVRFLTADDVKRLVSEGQNAIGHTQFVGVQFCVFYMKVFLNVFIEKPYLLLDNNLKGSVVILYDIVKFCMKRRFADDVYEKILDMIDVLWPIYEEIADDNKKINLLYNLTSFPVKLDSESNPLKWVAAQLASELTTAEMKTRLVTVLPSGENFSECYTNFASYCLGSTLSSERGEQAALRAALDALASNGDRNMLRLVATLADTDENVRGWWDEAMNSCSATLAATKRMELYNDLYEICFSRLSREVCDRLMLPLLRYSSPSLCEEFFSEKLKDLLQIIQNKPREAVANVHYHNNMIKQTIALCMLQVACEKIKLTSLESPNSLLYKHIENATAKYLIKTLSTICIKLRKDALPSGADVALEKSFWLFHCAIYKCLCAAICRVQQLDKFHKVVIGQEAWSNIVRASDTYSLPIIKKHRETRLSVSIEVAGVNRVSSLSTVRTRMFRRTLSEHPLHFDMFDAEDNEVKVQEVQMTENEINQHICAGTITALITQAAVLRDVQWLKPLADALDGNAATLIAQVICNCKEELKPHASELRPALLAYIARTPRIINGVKLVNGLHIDILDTLKSWSDDVVIPERSQKHLALSMEYLITTTIKYNDKWYFYVLEKFLDVYGQFLNVEWSVFDAHLKNIESAQICLLILKKLTKHKVHMPELIPTLLKQKLEYWYKEINIPKIFGEALSYESDKDSAIRSFRNMLRGARRNNNVGYLKMMYYAQLGCPLVCDEENFIYVTDQTPKHNGELKDKCLRILSTYIAGVTTSNEYIKSMFETISLSELIADCNVDAMILIKNGLHLIDESLKRRVVRQASEACTHSSPKIRLHAHLLMVAAFEELFKKESEPTSKRIRKSTTDILLAMDASDPYTQRIMQCVGMGVIDIQNMDVAMKIGKVLSTDMRSRLAECVLTCLYLPHTKTTKSCVQLLEILFSELRSKEGYKASKLSDEPLQTVQQLSGPSKLLTLTSTRTYQVSFLSYSGVSGRRRTKATETTTTGLDVQVTIDNILGTLLEFSKKYSDVARTLTVQVFNAIRDSPNRGFDFDGAIAKPLASVLQTNYDVTPLFIELARVVLDAQRDSFQTATDKLKDIVKNSEGEPIVKCLIEDIEIRKPKYHHFDFGPESNDEDVFMDENTKTFDLKDLVSCFGKLSSWDDLTVRQRSEIEDTGLPTIWTDLDNFVASLNNYEVSTSNWFDKMVLAYRGECKRDSARWLREIEDWPYRHFDASTVTEIVSWSEECGSWPSAIMEADCLVSWAARLMIRIARYNATTEDEADNLPFRSHELLWCIRANEMEIHRPVLECYERNSSNLIEIEKFPWLHEKLVAMTGMGVKTKDNGLLKNALNLAEKNAFSIHSNSQADVDTSMGICKLMITLNKQLDTLSTDKLRNILDKINRCTNQSRNKSTLQTIYEMSIIYYDNLWTDDSTSQTEVINNLLLTYTQMMASNLGPSDMHIAVLFNRLDGYTARLDGHLSRKLLDVLVNNFDSFDDFTLISIENHIDMFPSDIIKQYKIKEMLDKDNIIKYKQYLDLLRDGRYSLQQYCGTMILAAQSNDIDTWDNTYQRILRMLDNHYGGSEYHLLAKYKEMLLEIQVFEKSIKIEKLKKIIQELRVNENKTLRLSQLCPALTKPDRFEKDGCIERLLSLKGRKVVKFHDQVTVFTGSIRRPTVFSVLLSDGTTRRYIHKAGEPPRRDAAAMRVARALNTCCIVYTVTPLSEDSGLIEFIENQVMLRALVPTKYNDVPVLRPPDDELILSPSLQTFDSICEQVPAYVIRSAIKFHSSCLQDFLTKKRRFQDTLAATTILNWIMGLGDRHLENILYMVADGSVCNVDWGALGQFGIHELPPARLTRNLMAVCDRNVLESRMQCLLKALRQSHRLLTNFITTSFKFDAELRDKFQYIDGMLSGKMLPYHVTRSVIEASNKQYKEKYCQLLDQVFQGFPVKEEYSVVEQISCLLRHCTHPRILNVTRSAWEPWI